ncbi:mitochondrial thiamine pyrophosphate carrier 1 [Rhizoclosmatium globosum]|uniref:Mitochondrial thiamine pyrophosphate carrier 1 n=1 Tax=Rhizoclosmatium globosum TaxID=329046 RepID=A0A1Y2BSH8_9FUNG|nr:mitochondrial thiamine pyrophosphate carrier 1 [Rhizoclosmatium globosum]|eukprot:ORY37597.1 mitochondrial thiamine pyrophosphate carrier 1 [Rhizoclosmatium globosum]
MEKEKRHITKLQNAASGALAGVISRLVIAPLDVVKIRFQLQTTSPSVKPKYRGITQSLILIAREEGLRALWKGNWPAEYLYLTYGALQFLVYHETMPLLASSTSSFLNPTAQSVVAGAFAGSIATLGTYPLDLLRTRFAMQGTTKVYQSLIGACGEIGRTEGIRGFYRGVWPSILQIAPYMGIMFGTQGAVEKWFESIQSPYWVHAWDHFLSGGVAGIVSKTAVMPFDVVRKRLQVQGPSRTLYVLSDIPHYANSGFLACARQIIAQEGVHALYKGLWVGLIKTAPSSAITFWVVAESRKAFETYNLSRK